MEKWEDKKYLCFSLFGLEEKLEEVEFSLDEFTIMFLL